MEFLALLLLAVTIVVIYHVIASPVGDSKANGMARAYGLRQSLYATARALPILRIVISRESLGAG
jgi:hypothetical protein